MNDERVVTELNLGGWELRLIAPKGIRKFGLQDVQLRIAVIRDSNGQAIPQPDVTIVELSAGVDR